MMKTYIPKEINELINDLNNLNLPTDLNDWNKLKCNLEIGQRIYWYFKEDAEYAKKCESTPRQQKPYSGIIIPKNGISLIGLEIESEDCVVIIDTYPCEKEYPECTWIALNRLVNTKDLIEIFSL